MDTTTLATGALSAAGGAGLGAWLTKVLIQRTLRQFDEAIKDVTQLKVELAVQKTVADKIVEPLRKAVDELRERLAKAEAANKKAQEADGILNSKLNKLSAKLP